MSAATIKKQSNFIDNSIDHAIGVDYCGGRALCYCFKVLINFSIFHFEFMLQMNTLVQSGHNGFFHHYYLAIHCVDNK